MASSHRSRRSGIRVRFEIQRDAIDAIAEAGGRWAIGEDVSEMAAASAAVDFRSHHEMTAIDGLPYRSFQRRKETWPTCAALKLPLVDEQRLAAPCALESAPPFLVE